MACRLANASPTIASEFNGRISDIASNVNMVAAAEVSGSLSDMLQKLAEYLDQEADTRAQVKSAMVYPIVVLSAAFMILLGLMTFVIPQFKAVLEEMVGGDLNKITQIVEILKLIKFLFPDLINPKHDLNSRASIFNVAKG